MLSKPLKGITSLVATSETTLPQDIQTGDTYSTVKHANKKAQ